MKNFKSIIIVTVLAAALVFPMTLLAQPPLVLPDRNFCADPVDFAEVDFGVGIANHQLDPDEVTITKDGTVTFNIAGGGHMISIYPVSLNTTRADIEEDLRQPDDTGCVNKESACDNNDQYLVTDGANKLVLDTGLNVADPGFTAFPRVNLAAGATSFLPAGTKVERTFYQTGRYMVICANRGHFISFPYMFGFVNVVNCGANK